MSNVNVISGVNDLSLNCSFIRGQVQHQNLLTNATQLLFFGDSWTDTYNSQSHMWHWSEIVGTALGVNYVNTGISASYPNQYLQATPPILSEREVSFANNLVPYNPSHIFILFGMNELLFDWDSSLSETANYQNIEDIITAFYAKLIALKPNATIVPLAYGDYVPYIAESTAGDNAKIRLCIKNALARNGITTEIINFPNHYELRDVIYTEDRLNLNELGQFMFAENILNELEKRKGEF